VKISSIHERVARAPYSTLLEGLDRKPLVYSSSRITLACTVICAQKTQWRKGREMWAANINARKLVEAHGRPY
jgi:hypothetical protein